MEDNLDIDFQKRIRDIINEGFTNEGLQKLDYYAELQHSGRLLFDRFSPREQYGCSKGGTTHVIATMLAGAKVETDTGLEGISGIKREFQQAALQAESIEQWSRKIGIWINNVDSVLQMSFGEEIAEGGEAKVYDNGTVLVKSIGLDYFIQPIYALDRISLHNAYFPETSMQVVGFGRNSEGEFKIIVEQPYIIGSQLSENEIEEFLSRVGFSLKSRSNWTYATPDIYLSDMHDENLIKSAQGNIYVIDCDIRINTPDLKQDGVRSYDFGVTLLD